MRIYGKSVEDCSQVAAPILGGFRNRDRNVNSSDDDNSFESE
jgi:hypothetical protein